MPEIWKQAEVIPIHKVKPPRTIEKDLRPISLTPVLCKELESFIMDWVWEELEDIIDESQFGAIAATSTTHALIQMLHSWLSSLEDTGTYIRILLLDFSKAFDLIDHQTLLRKLRGAGTHECIAQWMTEFLLQRKQYVRINGNKSTLQKLNGGVPQGTKSGPRMFLMMINDLQTSVPTCKYVDDTTLYAICHRDRPTGHDIQEAANEAAQWTEENHMRLNASKTKEMLVYFGKKPINVAPVVINGIGVERVKSAKLVGVTISEDMTWTEHVNVIHGRGSRRLYFLRLLKRSGASPHDIIKVYTSIIRPVMEYACPVWHSSLTKSQASLLENVQRRALKIAYPDIDYESAMVTSGIVSLSERRTELCRKRFAKIQRPDDKLHHLLPEQRNTPYSLRCAKRLCVPRARTNRFKYSFIPWALANCQ